MHHQLQSLLTENTFNGTTKGMKKKKDSLETANKFHIFEKIAKKNTPKIKETFLYLVLQESQGVQIRSNENAGDNDVWGEFQSFSSNVRLPLIPDPPPMFSQLLKIITRVHSASH